MSAFALTELGHEVECRVCQAEGGAVQDAAKTAGNIRAVRRARRA